MLAAGAPPDIVMPIGIGGVAELYDTDAWLDLQPLVDRDNYDMSDFYGPTVTLHTYAKGTLGLPLAVYPSFIYYNKDLFEAGGVDELPHKFGEAGWDFDKLEEISRKLTLDGNGVSSDKAGFDPMDMRQWGYDESWMDFAGLARQFGATSATGVSDDYKTSIWDDPAYGLRAQWVNDAIWKNYMMASPENATEAFALAGNPFLSGVVGMWHVHTWMMGERFARRRSSGISRCARGPTGVITPGRRRTFVMARRQQQDLQGCGQVELAPGNLERFAMTWGSVPAVSPASRSFKSRSRRNSLSRHAVVRDAIDYGTCQHDG